jgi:hypothetical protein
MLVWAPPQMMLLDRFHILQAANMIIENVSFLAAVEGDGMFPSLTSLRAIPDNGRWIVHWIKGITSC